MIFTLAPAAAVVRTIWVGYSPESL
jgi:hypothetical protein